MTKTKTQTKCLRNPTQVTLVTLFRSYNQFYRGVSPFQDFFLGIVVHMWFRHRWKFCVFHHKKKELSFVYFLTNSSGSVFQLSETNILDIVIVIDFGQLANIGEYWFWRRLQRSGARDAESPLRNKLSNIRGNYSPQPLAQNWRESRPLKIEGWTKQPFSAQLLAQMFVNIKNWAEQCVHPCPILIPYLPFTWWQTNQTCAWTPNQSFSNVTSCCLTPKKHGTIWLLRSPH